MDLCIPVLITLYFFILLETLEKTINLDLGDNFLDIEWEGTMVIFVSN